MPRLFLYRLLLSGANLIRIFASQKDSYTPTYCIKTENVRVDNDVAINVTNGSAMEPSRHHTFSKS